jgi:hypothetical protein
MCNGNSTPAPIYAQPTATVDVEIIMEHIRAQLDRERRMMLAWVDERERALGIQPRTADIRRWWYEQHKNQVS